MDNLVDINITQILLIVFAYLLGSISPSIIQGKLRGIDIRSVGSGNAGTTNTLRTLGGKAALITMIVDILKGVIAVLLGLYFGGPNIARLCALFAFVGHIYPVYYGFKGGKGVATAFGVIVAINWKLGICVLLVVAAVTVLTKRMSPGSITGAVLFPFLCWWLEPAFLPEAVVMAILVVYKHRSNIQRIIRKEEPPMSIFVKKEKKQEENK